VTVRVTLGALMRERRITLTTLSRRAGVTLANLSILKNNHSRALRFSTLNALCRALDCQPGDLLHFEHASSPTQKRI
jgi:putative transcriptional regulator